MTIGSLAGDHGEAFVQVGVAGRTAELILDGQLDVILGRRDHAMSTICCCSAVGPSLAWTASSAPESGSFVGSAVHRALELLHRVVRP
jgi:hypothetical protein